MPVSRNQLESAALRFLSRREYGRAELIEKLCRRYPDARAQCIDVVTALSEKGYQSDVRFAQSVSRARMRKGYGPRVIAFFLAQKGIEKAVVSRCMAHYTVLDWVAVMQSWWRKYGKHKEVHRSHALWVKRGFCAEHTQAWMQERTGDKESE